MTEEQHRERIETICGKKSGFLTSDEVLLKCATYESLIIDLGTGDGAFAYRYARENPTAYVFGVDPSRSQLRHFSHKVSRKPGRGGLGNVMYVIATIDSLPGCFSHLFDKVFINYPWASLLRGILNPEPAVLAQLQRITKPTAHMEFMINMHVITDEKQRSKLELPALDEQYVETHLKPSYAAYGFQLTLAEFLTPESTEIPSTWGGRLIKGSGRSSARLHFERIKGGSSVCS